MFSLLCAIIHIPEFSISTSTFLLEQIPYNGIQKKKEHLQHIYTVGTKALVLSSCMQEQHKPTLINLGYRVSELETTNSAGNAQSMAHTHKDPN